MPSHIYFILLFVALMHPVREWHRNDYVAEFDLLHRLLLYSNGVCIRQCVFLTRNFFFASVEINEVLYSSFEKD